MVNGRIINQSITRRERRFPLRIITLNLVCVAPVQDWLKIRYRMFYNDLESSFFLRLNIKKLSAILSLTPC